MSSASSAIGTGTVLGMHSALSPDAPAIQGDLRQANVDESKNWLKIDFSGASTFFFIALVISICLILGITLPCCCGRESLEEQKLIGDLETPTGGNIPSEAEWCSTETITSGPNDWI